MWAEALLSHFFTRTRITALIYRYSQNMGQLVHMHKLTAASWQSSQ